MTGHTEPSRAQRRSTDAPTETATHAVNLLQYVTMTGELELERLHAALRIYAEQALWWPTRTQRTTAGVQRETETPNLLQYVT